MLITSGQLTVVVQEAVDAVNDGRETRAVIMKDYVPRYTKDEPACLGVAIGNRQHGEFFAELVDAIYDEFGEHDGFRVFRQVVNDKRIDVRPGKSVTYFPGYVYEPENIPWIWTRRRP